MLNLKTELVTALVIKDIKENILLVSSPKWREKWVIPGGHIKEDESIEKAALREAYEETGFKCKRVRVITKGEAINPTDFLRPAHFVYHIVEMRVENKSGLRLNEELSNFKWTSLDNALKENLTDIHKKILLDYKQNI